MVCSGMRLGRSLVASLCLGPVDTEGLVDSTCAGMLFGGGLVASPCWGALYTEGLVPSPCTLVELLASRRQGRHGIPGLFVRAVRWRPGCFTVLGCFCQHRCRQWSFHLFILGCRQTILVVS